MSPLAQYAQTKVLKPRVLSPPVHTSSHPLSRVTATKAPFGIILSLLQGFNYKSQLFQRVHFWRGNSHIKNGFNAHRTLRPWKYGSYVVHASKLTPGSFVFGVDTSLNAESVNHWARVTAVTLPIHAITEIAEHTRRIYNLHVTHFANYVFFLPFTWLRNSKQRNHLHQHHVF